MRQLQDEHKGTQCGPAGEVKLFGSDAELAYYFNLFWKMTDATLRDMVKDCQASASVGEDAKQKVSDRYARHRRAIEELYDSIPL
ncbi:hypothetical protein OT109_09355 [Phycisphaeraceae bacterium D3-23]